MRYSIKGIAALYTALIGIFFITTSAYAAETITVPSGTRIMARMVDSVNTQQHAKGHKFTAKLEGDLVADGKVIAPRGATLYGIVADMTKARRVAGKASLLLQFTDVMINNQLVAISTTPLEAQGPETAGKSAGQVARGAAIGGLADGSKGAKTGAKVGAGAAILSGGDQISVPSGTLIEFQLQAPLTVPAS